MTDSVREYFQWANLIGCILLTLLTLRLWLNHRDIRGLVVFPSIWGLGGAVYYLLVLGDVLSPGQVLLWGAVHRLLAIVMVTMFFVSLYVLVMESAEETDDPQD